MEGQNGVVAVVLAGEQRRELHIGYLSRHSVYLRLYLVNEAEVLGLVPKLDKRRRVVTAGAELLIALILCLEPGHALGHLLGVRHIVPARLGGLELQHLHLLPQPVKAQGVPKLRKRLALGLELPVQFFKLQHISIPFPECGSRFAYT